MMIDEAGHEQQSCCAHVHRVFLGMYRPPPPVLRQHLPQGGRRVVAVGTPAAWDVQGIVPQRLPTLSELQVMRERLQQQDPLGMPNLQRRYILTLADADAGWLMPQKGGGLRKRDRMAAKRERVPAYGVTSYGHDSPVATRRYARPARGFVGELPPLPGMQARPVHAVPRPRPQAQLPALPTVVHHPSYATIAMETASAAPATSAGALAAAPAEGSRSQMTIMGPRLRA